MGMAAFPMILIFLMPPPPGSEGFFERFGHGWVLEGLAKPVALWSPGPWSRGPWSRGLWSFGQGIHIPGICTLYWTVTLWDKGFTVSGVNPEDPESSKATVYSPYEPSQTRHDDLVFANGGGAAPHPTPPLSF